MLHGNTECPACRLERLESSCSLPLRCFSDDERSSVEACGYDGVRAIYAVPIPIDDAVEVDRLLPTGGTERRPDQTSFTKRW